jgi:hypothetical protein
VKRADIAELEAELTRERGEPVRYCRGCDIFWSDNSEIHQRLKDGEPGLHG